MAQRKAQKTARAYHHGDLRHALLEAARAELKAVGRDALSLRSVARRAGVTHTAAYHHFKDKQDLLASIAVAGFRSLEQHMRAGMDAAGSDPVERLLGAGRGYLQHATQDPAAYDLMFNGCDFKTSEELQQTSPITFLLLVEAVTAAREATGTTVGTPLEDALVVWEAVHGCAMLVHTGQHAFMGIDPDEHARFLMQRLRRLFVS